MNFPTDVKYTKDHEWIRVDGDVAYVGITDYAQSELGEIVYVDITTEGETVGKEEFLCYKCRHNSFTQSDNIGKEKAIVLHHFCISVIYCINLIR